MLDESKVYNEKALYRHHPSNSSDTFGYIQTSRTTFRHLWLHKDIYDTFEHP